MKFTIDVPDDKIDNVQAALDLHGITLHHGTDSEQASGGGKAQHRWKKDIASTVFQVNYAGCTGSVIWQRPTEMLLKKGAKMLPDSDAPRRKDGTLGFTAKFAQTLREENADSYDHKKFVTTKDIVLRSVNEVGHFLYFAGTNSWLHMKTQDGKTIDELTVVK